jgi:hypothetical protein
MSTAIQEGRFETTTPLMKTAQVQEANEEKSRLEETLNAPPHIGAQIQNRGDMVRQLRTISRQLDTQMPRAYESDQRDAAVAREKELREKWLAGMPTAASHELALENAQITRPDYHFGGPVGPKTVLTESDLKLLEEVAPEIRMKVALLDEGARAQIKEIIEAARAAPPEEPAPAPKKGAKAK